MQVFHRQAIKFPGLDALSMEVVQRAERIDSDIKTVAALNIPPLSWVCQHMQRPSELVLTRLAHPLSDVAGQLTRSVWKTPRTEIETKVAATYSNAIRDAVKPGADPNVLCGIASIVASALIDRNIAFRDHEVSLLPDKAGNIVRFVPHFVARQQMIDLANHLQDWPAPSAIRGACAMAAILNAHPFPDGNGRTSRVMFNSFCLGPGFPGYLPFFEVAAASLGGFEIRLRILEVRGDWEPLLTYVCDVVEFYLETIRSGHEQHIV